MKKFICIVLALTLVFGSSLAIGAFAKEDEKATGFAVASDIHYVTPTKNANSTPADEGIETTFNSEGDSLYNQSGFIIDEFLRQCAENPDCRFVLITGDLATHGRDFASEHEALAAKFRKFENETGKQVYVINGNHDNTSKGVISHKEFVSIYHEFGYDEALSTDEGTCSYSVNLDDEYTLVAFDSCDERYRVVPNNDLSRMNWAVKQIRKAKSEGRKVIMIMHHNLLEHNPYQKITEKNYVVDTPYSFAGLLADLGVKLVFTGHTHRENVTSYTSFAGNTVYDFSMPSLGNFPAEYKFVKITDEEINYETKKIEHIDADKLAEVCKGFSDEDIALMKNDFQQYTWNKSFKYYSETLSEDISPELLGVEESSALYGRLKLVTDGIKEMFNTPIYAEGGIRDQAAEYGLTVPQSDYQTLCEALTTAVLRCKIGEKVYLQDSDDFNLIIKLLAFSVRKSAADAADEDILSDANALLQKLGYNGTAADNMLKNFSEKYGYATPEEKEALSVAFALFGGYCSETDGVDNRSGTIPGYGIKEGTQNKFVVMFENTAREIIKIIKKLLSVFVPMPIK